MLESVLSDEREGNGEVRAKWLQWRGKSARRLQELENEESQRHPRAFGGYNDDERENVDGQQAKKLREK